MSAIEIPQWPEMPTPTPAELALAYEVGARSRCTEEHIVRLVSRGEVKFAIWGPGEEVHGTATALALSKVVPLDRFGLVPHYRSGALCSMWTRLHGYDAFTLDVLRQQFSKDTDRMSRGRQMVYHLDMKEYGILPVQSPVGMQLGKAAGYALGFKLKGQQGFGMAVVGDGTTAEGDMHDTMSAASVWSLPLLILVTDNNVAISTTPAEGRGIKDFVAYANSFGIAGLRCDGRDFDDVYSTTARAAHYIYSQQKPLLIHVHSLPRFNGHSSAADVTYDLSQDDPLIRFAERLVRDGVLGERDALRRVKGEGRDFFAHHDLGNVMGRQDEELRAMLDQVRAEPDPDPASVTDHIRAPFPPTAETAPGPGTTNITYAGAIRAAIKNIFQHHNGALWGEDVARLGGVMTATAGLKKRFPERIFDAPLNEPLIVGTACGAGLHGDLVTMPEIQFGDYSLNAFHWLVHMGNLYWCTNGRSNFATIVRMPVDPFGGGAVYHSMSVDGYFTPIPGLTIVMPSTSFDAYGLLMAAAEYRGPVVVLEPKWMYRQNLGPAFPNEPQDPAEISALKKSIMRGEVPDLDPAMRVPLGKGTVRRPGSDVTCVAWGRAVWTAVRAAEELEKDGISLEVIDLRTLVPPDMDLIYASLERTGRLLVAAEDRSFAGFVRQIQGDCVERFPGLPARGLGQKYIPGIAQCLALEEATVLTAEDIVRNAREIVGVKVGTSRTKVVEVAPRYFLV